MPRREPADPEALLKQRHAGRTVLVAEDKEVNREIASAMLVAVGLHVDTAVEGQQVLLKATSGRYDLVRMDMQMPGMDGLEATRQIRRLSDWADVPILALTANVLDGDREAWEEASMNGFIAKPMEAESLYQGQLTWLNRRAADGIFPGLDWLGIAWPGSQPEISGWPTARRKPDRGRVTWPGTAARRQRPAARRHPLRHLAPRCTDRH